ncbi:sterol O-acyltransferase 1 [Sorex araneus]|uniref:sterol O-acyltransferase 1 n=1 Tax=Sorex araneus TaxID=42254 RepID=UPI0024333D66|nr:sterol O-acyltransferase 1 [Sorex araneus]
MSQEDMSLRKRLARPGDAPEDAADPKAPSKDAQGTPGNGQIDMKQLIAKKMKLTAEAEELKPAFLKEVGSHFDDFVSSLIEKSATLDSGGCPLTSFAALRGEKNHRAQDLRAPPEKGKVFVVRRSLLDELLEVDHIRTIYHMFIALLILFILSTLAVDYIDQGRLVLEFNMLTFAFTKSSVALWTWWAMFLGTLVVPYTLLLQWAKGYRASSFPSIRSLLFGLLFMAFQVGGLGCGVAYVVLQHTSTPGTRGVIVIEQIRFVMKAHSLVRETVPRVLSAAKAKSDTVPVPTVGQYLYFLFAPTLIYRDSYPRTPSIRWGYVALQFAQVFGCFFYMYYIFERLCTPLFRNMQKEPFSARVLVLCMFNSILPAALILFLTFFAILHCWLNAFAEMLRFGDRMFYRDWWNSTSYANYYRTWNVVVHDWLYYYAYKDFLWFFSKKFKSAAMLSVFAISAVVHEYAMAIILNFFYPVLFVLFMFFGMAFNFIVNDSRKRPIWNIMVWTSLFAGHGILLCLYSQEWHARQHCPLKNPTFLDYIQPRSWTCRFVF